MRLMLVLLATAFCSFAQAEVCGGTVQTFWRIDIQKKDLAFRKSFRHPKTKFCEADAKVNTNTEVSILDANKKMIRKFRTYIPVETYMDANDNGKLRGGSTELNRMTVQIKFAEDIEFKRAKYLKLQFDDGKIYGPTLF